MAAGSREGSSASSLDVRLSRRRPLGAAPARVHVFVAPMVRRRELRQRTPAERHAARPLALCPGLRAIVAQLTGGRGRDLAYKDLRDYLAALEVRGKLHHVKKEVDPGWGGAAGIPPGFPRI